MHIVYIDENCQAIIFFINLGLDLGMDMKQELHIPLAKVLEMFTT